MASHVLAQRRALAPTFPAADLLVFIPLARLRRGRATNQDFRFGDNERPARPAAAPLLVLVPSALPAPSYRVAAVSPARSTVAGGLSGALWLRHFRLQICWSLSLWRGCAAAARRIKISVLVIMSDRRDPRRRRCWCWCRRRCRRRATGSRPFRRRDRQWLEGSAARSGSDISGCRSAGLYPFGAAAPRPRDESRFPFW